MPEPSDDISNQYLEDEVAQLELGESLLREAEVDQADGSKAIEAIKWLLKSSRKGNDKATELLKKCLENNIGVNETNIQDVKWCISTSSWEKRSRAAASKLFRKICLEDNKLTPKEYNKRVQELSQNSKEKKLLEKAAKNGISEEAFVERVIYQLKGKSKWSLHSLMRVDADDENISSWKKALLNPIQTLTWIADNIVETAGTQGMNWLRTLIPVQQVYLLVVLFIYSMISVDAILWIFPIIGFYISFVAIVICTMQMFYAKRKLSDVKALADVLERFGETFIQESAESAYSWSSLTPYVSFFVSLPFMIITFVIADKAWVPCAEICCIAFLITVASWFALSDNYDYLAILAILLDNVSTLPEILDRLPRIPVVYEILNVIGSSGYSLEVTPGFSVNFGIPSVAYLTVPVVFVVMAMKNSWKGTYQIMIPHLVCFFWWRIVVMLYMETTWYGLLKASFGWGIIVVISPFLFIIGLLWLLFHVLKIFSISGIMKVATTMCLLGGVGLYTYWSRGGFKLGKFSLEKKSYKSNLILTIVMLTSFVPLLYISTPEADDSGKLVHYLPWEVYDNHCGDSAKSSSLQTMDECQHFLQTKVNWEGTVQQIIIKKVDNPAESFVHLLPTILSEWLKCTYGVDYETMEESSDILRDVSKYTKLQGRNCHLKTFGRFTFEIEIAIETSKVKLLAPHTFQDTLTRLKKNDIISFKGYLMENLFTPTVNIYSLKCLNCMEELRAASQRGERTFVDSLKHGICKIFNFFFSPLIVLE